MNDGFLSLAVYCLLDLQSITAPLSRVALGRYTRVMAKSEAYHFKKMEFLFVMNVLA